MRLGRICASRKGRWVYVHKTLTHKTLVQSWTDGLRLPFAITFCAILDKSKTGSEWLPWTCLAPTIASLRNFFRVPRIVLDRFHIVQHLSRAMNRLRIKIMNLFDRKSLEYRALKRYWKLIQQNSRKLSDKRFYRPTFRMHLTNREVLYKLLQYSEELWQHYELYQLLLFHFQEKQSEHFFELLRRAFRASILSSGLCLDL